MIRVPTVLKPGSSAEARQPFQRVALPGLVAVRVVAPDLDAQLRRFVS
jgi:hypothetical protein